MTNITYLDVVTTLDISPERVIDAAKEAELQDVVVIGYDKDGDFYFAANQADGKDVLWLLEVAKKKLLEAGEE